MNCAHCMDHKGWHFEAVKRKLTLKKIFGLCGSGLASSYISSAPNIETECYCMLAQCRLWHWYIGTHGYQISRIC